MCKISMLNLTRGKTFSKCCYGWKFSQCEECCAKVLGRRKCFNAMTTSKIKHKKNNKWDSICSVNTYEQNKESFFFLKLIRGKIWLVFFFFLIWYIFLYHFIFIKTFVWKYQKTKKYIYIHFLTGKIGCLNVCNLLYRCTCVWFTRINYVQNISFMHMNTVVEQQQQNNLESLDIFKYRI